MLAWITDAQETHPVTTAYWRCLCRVAFWHSASQAYCPTCGAEQGDSAPADVADLLLTGLPTPELRASSCV